MNRTRVGPGFENKKERLPRFLMGSDTVFLPPSAFYLSLLVYHSLADCQSGPGERGQGMDIPRFGSRKNFLEVWQLAPSIFVSRREHSLVVHCF